MRFPELMSQRSWLHGVLHARYQRVRPEGRGGHPAGVERSLVRDDRRRTRSGARVPRWVGGLAFLVVLGAAFGVYYGATASSGGRWPWRKSEQAASPRAITGRLGQEWYADNLEFWKSLEFTPLRDRERLHVAVRQWVEARFEGPEIQEDLLSRDIADFLYALAVDDAGEYLNRVAPKRTLRAGLYANKSAHAWYRMVVSKPLPRDADPRAVFEMLWQSTPDAAGRPVAVSKRAVMQVGRSRPLPPEGLPPGYRLFNATLPKLSMFDQLQQSGKLDHWLGTFTQGFPDITRASQTYEEVFESNRTVLVCEVFFPVQTTDDKTFLACLALYLSPAEAAWHVEVFSHYYPYSVCWPY